MISFSIDNLTFHTNGEGLSVSMGKQSYYLSREIIIPSQVIYDGKQYVVNEIDKDAFKDCNDITSVVIPSSVYLIGDHAFAYCINLLSVTIPSSVSLIGNSAFTCCRALLSVTIPSSVTFLGDRIFDHCTALTTVHIHSKVSSIGACTFSFCRALTSLTLPEGILSIGISAFSYCKSLTSIHIPSSVIYIGDSAFEHCSNINTFTGASKVISVGIDAFKGTSWYHNQPYGLLYIGELAYIYFDGSEEAGSSVVIKEGTKAISSQAFKDCREVSSIFIPSSVRSVGFEAFANCHSITSIILPEGISWIGARSFSGCTSLTTIMLPSTLKSIGVMAFLDCGNLKTIYSLNNKPPKIKFSFSNIEKDTCILYVPKGVQSTYIKAEWWRKFKNVIELEDDFELQPELETISSSKSKEKESPANYTLFGEKIILPVPSEQETLILSAVAGTIDIEEKAAFFVDGISYVMDEEGTSVSVTEQEAESISSNLTLPSYILYNGLTYPVTSIGRSAFQGYDKLLSVEIPEGITLINGHAFSGCSSLHTVTIPESVTSIRGNAFSGCGRLSSISIPPNVTWLGTMVFSNCSSLTSVSIPEGVTTIDKSIFLDCSSLTTVSIPSSVRSVDASAFEGCVSLLEIHLLNSEPPMVDTDWLFLDDFTFGILCVPVGATTAYMNAQWWRRFKHIQEDIIFSENIASSEDIAPNEEVSPSTPHVSEVVPIIVESSSVSTKLPAPVIEEIVYPTTETSCLEKDGVNHTITFGGLRYIINESDLSANVAEQYGDTLPEELLIPSEVIYQEVKYPVKVILAAAFMGCSSLRSVTISSGVRVIREKAFAGCRNLKIITIPDTVRTIGLNIFSRCSELQMMFIQSVIPPFVMLQSSFVDPSSSCVLYVPKGSKQDYSQTKWCNGFISIQEKDGESDQAPIPTSLQAVSAEVVQNEIVEFDVPSMGPISHNEITPKEAPIAECVETPVVQRIETPMAERIEPRIAERIETPVVKRIESSIEKETLLPIAKSRPEKKVDKNSILVDGLRFVIDERDIYVSVSLQDSATLSGDLIIPSEVTYLGKSYPVASITGSAFKNCTNLTTIKIAEGVSIIGNEAFKDCGRLTSVTLPSTISLIGEKTFKGCRRLTDVFIQNEEPPTVDSSESIIDDASFCTLIVPKGCKTVYSRKRWCRNFVSVTEECRIDEQIANPFPSATRSEKNDIKTELTFNGLKYVIDEEGNSVSVSVQDKNTISGNISIPSEVIYKTTKYPVESIVAMAFKDCANLISVTISSGVTTIGDEAFRSCGRLNNVTIPSSVRIIGDDSFIGCRRLEAISIQNIIPPTVVSRRSILDEGALCNLCVPVGSKVVYSKTKWCNNFLSIEEEGSDDEESNTSLRNDQSSSSSTETTYTEEESNIFLFDGLRYIKNEDSATVSVSDQDTDMISGDILMPPSVRYHRVDYPVTSISASAFKGCTNLKSVIISSGVRIIRADAFADCSSLSSITIPASVRIIGFNVFSGCRELQRMYIQSIDPPAVVAQSSILDEGSYCVLYVPEESKPLYVRTKWCNGFKSILEIRTVDEQENSSFRKILSDKTKGAQKNSNGKVADRSDTNVPFSERLKNLFDK